MIGNEAYKNLANAVFTIEGNSEHLDSLMQIFQKCGNDIIKNRYAKESTISC